MSQGAQEAVFDDLYRASRFDVLLQTFLLTGDLTAATSAVKDAYAITWQHWPKVLKRQAKGEDPLSYLRPLAWRLAQRRHTGRIWHRNKGLGEEHKEVLDAVHRLGASHRRVVLLVEVAGLEPADAARELAMTHDSAQRRLDEARSELVDALGPAYLERLLGMAGPAAAVRLPRPTVLLRAGRERRRVQTVIAVLGAVALTVGVGAAAREPGLERASAVHQVRPGGDAVGAELPDGVELTTPSQLLQPYQLTDLAPSQTWQVERTDTNTRGDGINSICQQARFADPRGLAALVRTFTTTTKPTQSLLQSVEISRTDEAAASAYEATVGWFAGCQAARVQMVGAHSVAGVGDQAELLQIRVAEGSVSTYHVGVARVGEITTTLVARTVGRLQPEARIVAAALSEALEQLCPEDRPGCAGSPTLTAAPPPLSGEEPGFVATVDLPPVGRISDPWVGVDSVDALSTADAPTRCDRASFGRAGATRARSRTFLIPDAEVPETFGLTETYGVFASVKAAQRFLREARGRVAGCEERDLTAEVTAEKRETTRGHDLSAWRFETQISDTTSVAFRVGFVRVGKVVARLTFVPTSKDDMDPATFEALVRRAGERLRELDDEP